MKRLFERIVGTRDSEFLPDALAVIETPPSPAATGLATVLCALLVAAGTWGWVGRLDVVATAQGKFQPVGRVKLVQPVETGKVLRILASNGSVAAAGDPVAEIDDTQALADVADARTLAEGFRAEAIRRRKALAIVGALGDATHRGGMQTIGYSEAVASSDIEPAWTSLVGTGARDREDAILKADLANLQSQLASLEAQAVRKVAERSRLAATIAEQRNLIGVQSDRLAMKETLLERDAGTRKDVIDAREQVQFQRTTLAQDVGQLAEADADAKVVAAETIKVIGTFAADNATRMGEAERQAADYEQRQAKAEARLSDLVLRAPIAGTVQASSLTSLGQVVTAGEEVMRVVPESGGLEVEAYMPNHDVGFVHVGQEAVVKVEAFPFTTYGTMRGRVVNVGRDAIPGPDADRTETDPASPLRASTQGSGQRMQNLLFPVTITVDDPWIIVDGRREQVTAGMSTTVEVRTGSRRIIEYLLSPILGTVSEGMRER